MSKSSKVGVVSVGLYLAFALYCAISAEHCFRTDGLFCNLGYVLPGLPWVIGFGKLADAFLPGQDISVDRQVFYVMAAVSMLINALLSYHIGRRIGGVITRQKN